MTNKVEYKVGDEVVLNCSVPTFMEEVLGGSDIYLYNFKDNVGVVSYVHCSGWVFLAEAIGGKGVGGISPSELQYIKHKPLPQMSTTYEKVTFSKLSTAFAEHEESPLYSLHCDGYGVASPSDITLSFDGVNSIYRKVEKPITPMEAAKEACREAIESSHRVLLDFSDFAEDATNPDAEGFDLEFIKVCKAIVKAYEGLMNKVGD